MPRCFLLHTSFLNRTTWQNCSTSDVLLLTCFPGCWCGPEKCQRPQPFVPIVGNFMSGQKIHEFSLCQNYSLVLKSGKPTRRWQRYHGVWYCFDVIPYFERISLIHIMISPSSNPNIEYKSTDLLLVASLLQYLPFYNSSNNSSIWIFSTWL